MAKSNNLTQSPRFDKQPNEDLISAVHDLDNKLFQTDGCIVIYSGFDDDGSRYVDISFFGKHILTPANSVTLADYIGAEDVIEALIKINEELSL